MNKNSFNLSLLLLLGLPTLTTCCVTMYGLGEGSDQNSVELCVADDQLKPASNTNLIEKPNTIQQGEIAFEKHEHEHELKEEEATPVEHNYEEGLIHE